SQSSSCWDPRGSAYPTSPSATSHPLQGQRKRTAPKRPSSIRDVFIDHRIDLAAKLLKALVLFSGSVFNFLPRSQGSILGKLQDTNQQSSPYREPLWRKHRASSRCMPIQILFILDEQTDLRKIGRAYV